MDGVGWSLVLVCSMLDVGGVRSCLGSCSSEGGVVS